MAFSGVLASTVGLLVLISLTNGQYDSTCTATDIYLGNYREHRVYPQLFYHCTANPEERLCAEGTIWDTKNNVCNYPSAAPSTIAPCSSVTRGALYPAVCCDNYYRCNGEKLEAGKCPAGQVFNNQSRACSPGNIGNANTCYDHKLCQRNQPPSGNPKPCNLIADSSSPCNYRTNDNGTISQVQSCAEGTRLDLAICTCVRDPSNPCMRTTNSSGSKTLDPQCRASFVADFSRFNGNNNPVAYSEKTGNTLPDYIDGVAVQYANGLATLTPGENTDTGAQSSIYIASFAGNQLSSNFVAEITFRATRQANSFGIISNTRDYACSPTFSFNATYNGNGAYQVNGIVTGVSALGTSQQTTNTAQVSLSITVGGNEFVTLRVIFYGRVMVQLINKGQSGTGNGQVVNSQESGVIGQSLFYNQCGFQIGRLLPGQIDSIVFREACANTELFRT